MINLDLLSGGLDLKKFVKDLTKSPVLDDEVKGLNANNFNALRGKLNMNGNEFNRGISKQLAGIKSINPQSDALFRKLQGNINTNRRNEQSKKDNFLLDVFFK